MNLQEIKEKVEQLMQDEQFKAKLSNIEDLDEMAALFQNEGIQVTGADLEAALENQSTSEELSEESLENVAGGFATGLLIAGIIIGGIGILQGYVDGLKKRLKKCGVIR